MRLCACVLRVCVRGRLAFAIICEIAKLFFARQQVSNNQVYEGNAVKKRPAKRLHYARPHPASHVQRAV